jgi:hypothetical protein
MDSQDTAESDTIFDKRVEAKALPLPLLKRITGDFSDGLEIGRGGFAVVYKVPTLSFRSASVRVALKNQVNADNCMLLYCRDCLRTG